MKRGYSMLAFDGVHKKDNVGHIMRSAFCFDVSSVIFKGVSQKFIENNRVNTPSAEKHVPSFITDDIFSNIPYNCKKVAIEIVDDAEPIYDLIHHERAVYIFGGENVTLSKEITDKCDQTIYIPSKMCFNVAMATHIVLYDRALKTRQDI
jgi:tRNA G18 (ribose-2'-O)-methylase SpoU